MAGIAVTSASNNARRQQSGALPLKLDARLPKPRASGRVSISCEVRSNRTPAAKNEAFAVQQPPRTLTKSEWHGLCS
jgi:hypothetical protein